MIVHSFTDIGLQRNENEDFYYADKDKGLFLIADGMGGHAGGEVASATAVRVFRDHFIGVTEENFENVFNDLTILANDEIYELSKRNSHLRGMGTTFIALAVHENKIFIAHVGDSRVYMVRDKTISQLTEDQNLAGELLKEGQITEDEAMTHPGKKMLTNALGRHDDFEIDFLSFDFLNNDIILMCTDGLVEFVKSDEIENILNGNKDLAKAGKKLLNLALKRGGEDNITLILIKNS
ncbi:MAG: Stp1/IreP family PP2C-type Ser/Thr phosphatase [Clostridiales bacterium]